MEKLKGSFSTAVQQSIETKPAMKDCKEFNFDIKIVAFKGKFCKSGLLEYTMSIAGMELSHQEYDVSKNEKGYTNTMNVGIEEVQYCFYLKSKSLYTKGYVDSWLHKKHSWNVKLVGF
jgi:hypothetical protein